MRTNTGSRIHGNGSRVGTIAMPDENTHLLPNGDGAAAHHDPKGFWRHVFLDPKTTPGLDSPKAWVKWPVHVFNVIKVVLLSSKSPSCRFAQSLRRGCQRLSASDALCSPGLQIM